MISRAPRRATASTGSSHPATPANTSSSSRRSRSLGTIFAMRAYLQCFVSSGQSGGYVRSTFPRSTGRHLVERGLRGHVETERTLGAALRRLRIEPMSPRSARINYDLAWRVDDIIFVA